jgi:hypothetical protein
VIIGERLTERQDTCMPLVAPVGQGDKIKRIQEVAGHAYRFGKP